MVLQRRRECSGFGLVHSLETVSHYSFRKCGGRILHEPLHYLRFHIRYPAAELDLDLVVLQILLCFRVEVLWRLLQPDSVGRDGLYQHRRQSLLQLFEVLRADLRRRRLDEGFPINRPFLPYLRAFHVGGHHFPHKLPAPRQVNLLVHRVGRLHTFAVHLNSLDQSARGRNRSHPDLPAVR